MGHVHYKGKKHGCRNVQVMYMEMNLHYELDINYYNTQIKKEEQTNKYLKNHAQIVYLYSLLQGLFTRSNYQYLFSHSVS